MVDEMSKIEDKMTQKERFAQAGLFVVGGVLGVASKNIALGLPEVEALFRGYGADVMAPFAYYSLNRAAGARPSIATAIAVAPSIVGELGQKYEWWSGTYDPRDFLAYAAGIALGYCAERIIRKAFSKKIVSPRLYESSIDSIVFDSPL